LWDASVERYRCLECGGDGGERTGLLPVGWVTVEVRASEGEWEAMIGCSVGCVREWLEERKLDEALGK
jgi:hypothetical protein